MDQRYFPKCPVDGPIEPPMLFGHFALRGAVPNKCSTCDMLFEGECTRDIGSGGYKHLDHGPCGVDGPTDPVYYEDEFVSAKKRVPRKCVSCCFLRVKPIHGFVCTKDADKWGDLHRSLDWGEWKPDRVYRRLAHPKGTNDKMLRCAHENDLIGFIREHRRINPGVGLLEAKADFQFLTDQ